MPMVLINPKTGPANVHYTISTPTSPSADQIDPALPTIILIHPVYIPQHVYHTQFSDPKLRRFNLIGVDTRLHGDTEGCVSEDWRRQDAADDLVAFMDALKLPPCHLLGMSMGACISLQTAVSYPDKVLSLFLVSPLPLYEPIEVIEGRQEIYDCLVQGWSNFDEGARADAMRGALQLGFNDSDLPICRALINHSIPKALNNDMPPERFGEWLTMSVTFFADRAPHPLEALSKIQGPIMLVQCGGDIAYPVHYAEAVLQRLLDAGLKAELHSVDDAPHFGTVTHADEINSLLHDFIIEHTNANLPLPPDEATSPWEAELIATGYFPDNSDSSSEDEEIYYRFESQGTAVIVL